MMAIIKTELKTESNPDDVIYPKTSADQVDGLENEISSKIPKATTSTIGGIKVPTTSPISGIGTNLLQISADGSLETVPFYLHTISLTRSDLATSEDTSNIKIIFTILSRSSVPILNYSDFIALREVGYLLNANGCMTYTSNNVLYVNNVIGLTPDYSVIEILFNQLSIPTGYNNIPYYDIDLGATINNSNLSFVDDVEPILKTSA